MYVGLDPGTNLVGWAYVDSDGTHKASGWHDLSSRLSSDLKGWDNLYVRLARLSRWLNKFFGYFEEDEIMAVGIEFPWFGKNSQTAIKLGVVWGMVCQAASSRGWTVLKIEPAKAKAAMFGKGNASKDEMVQVANILGASCEGKGAEDQADALGVALATRRVVLAGHRNDYKNFI